jgi:aminopeptidase N
MLHLMVLYIRIAMRTFKILFLLLFYGQIFAQQKHPVDFKRISVEIMPLIDAKEICGKGTYDFELTAKTDSIFIDAVDMTFSYVSLNGKKIDFTNSKKQLGFKAPRKVGHHQLFLRYLARPKQTVYFLKSSAESSKTMESLMVSNQSAELEQIQIWTQGQGKYTSHWLPSFDDMTEKIELDLTLLVEEEYQVIANGQLQEKILVDGLVEWKFDMTDPMSSYLAAFVVGHFKKKAFKSKSGIPIELYYEPIDSLRFEPTYRYTIPIFDFLEEEIGVPYPWQNYKQVPVHDFLYAGMENTTATIFSDSFVIDSTAFVDRNYVNVNAHELAHQWFGNLVTEKNGDHHWLHEGFATYYSYLAEKQLFGDAHFYWKLHETASMLHDLSENGEGEALTDPKASSTTFYEKGAWALVMLRERVGDIAFKKGIKNYLTHFSFKNVTITDFLREMEIASGLDLADFKETWLTSKGFPWEVAKAWLIQENRSIRNFYDTKTSEKATALVSENTPIPYILATMERDQNTLGQADLLRFLRNEAPLVRQKGIQLLDSIPSVLKSSVVPLLNDVSYITQELSLFRLWAAFPSERHIYLDQTKDVIGLPSKNVRLLWLTLALVTPDYEIENKPLYYNELVQYTSSIYNPEVRQGAFQYLLEIQALNDEALLHLIKSTTHHSWQFRQYGRRTLDQVLEIETMRNKIKTLSKQLKDDDLSYLKTKLNVQ